MQVPKSALAWWENWNAKHPEAKIDIKKMEQVRRRCYTDHAFLAKAVGYQDFVPEVHDEIWNFYLKKDPEIQPFKKWAQGMTITHDGLLLTPRNGFKSTTDMVDICQYIICWPDITILLITGKEDRGREFLGEITGYFTRNDDGTPKVINGAYSLFQLAFPEFCIDGAGPKDTFTVPCSDHKALNIKEPTLSFAGVETSQSGPHFDVIKFDDAITNENSNTATRLITIRNQVSYHRKMLHPYGVCEFIGTWYKPLDHYGFLIRAEEQNKTLFWSKGKADSKDIDGRECLTRILLRPAMWRKDDKPLELNGPLDEKDFELWFPERITWKWLMKELSTNPELFQSQLMNNPNLATSSRFSREVLKRQTKLFTELPEIHSGTGLLVQAWDTAYTDNSLSNYTVGMTALIVGGRYYFVDMVRGQFSDYDLPRVMAESMAKHRPHRVVIENANGVRWLAREVYREQERLNFRVGIEFAEIENTKNRKSVMAAPVVKLLGEGRVVLSNGIPYLEQLYDELEGFQNGAPNDDIVDSMSLLVNYFQYMPEASAAALRADVDEEMAQRRDHSLYNMIYGIGTGTFSPENQTEQRSTEMLPSWVTWSPEEAFR